MNTSTILKGTLFLGLSNTEDLKEQKNAVDDLISNNEDIDLEQLRAIYPEIQFSLSKNEIDPNLEIHEILISNVIWVGFAENTNTTTIQTTCNEIQAWFDAKGSCINGAELVAGLQADKAFSHLEFSNIKPSNQINFIELEII
jgi:hypothetical protein